MTETDQKAQYQTGEYQIGELIVLPKIPPNQPGTTITKQDFWLLIEGAATVQHEHTKGITIGVCVTSIVGLVGILSAVPEISKISNISLVCCLLLGAVILASVFLIRYFQRAAKGVQSRTSHQNCIERIALALKIPEHDLKHLIPNISTNFQKESLHF